MICMSVTRINDVCIHILFSLLSARLKAHDILSIVLLTYYYYHYIIVDHNHS